MDKKRLKEITTKIYQEYGFVKKGTVYIKNGDERIAFQKIKQQ